MHKSTFLGIVKVIICLKNACFFDWNQSSLWRKWSQEILLKTSTQGTFIRWPSLCSSEKCNLMLLERKGKRKRILLGRRRLLMTMFVVVVTEKKRRRRDPFSTRAYSKND
jgi:hypothetical protein